MFTHTSKSSKRAVSSKGKSSRSHDQKAIQHATKLRTVAQYHEDCGDYEQAALFLTESLELRQKQLGSDHLEVAEDFYNLGLLHLAMDKNDAAEKLLVRSLLIRRLKFDADHPDVIETLDALSMLHEEQPLMHSFN